MRTVKESVEASAHNKYDKKQPRTTQFKSKHRGVQQIAISSLSLKCWLASPRQKQWAMGLSGGRKFGI